MALSELIRPRLREQVVQRMLTKLSTDPDLSANFVPTNYVPGDPLRTLLELAGEGIADVERTVSALGEGGYLRTAGGAWLAELVDSHYGVTRQPATFARGTVRFSAPLTGAVAVPPGMIVGTSSGLRYLVEGQGSIPAGDTLDLPARAESPGAPYNVPLGTVTVLHTPVPGLAVTNLAGWLTEAGADEETDEALRRRARLRWAELGGGATRAAYEYWALTAHPAVDRVRVLDEHPRGQGTADVVVWGAGGLGEDVIAAVNASVQARRPTTADILVYSAKEKVVPLPIELYAPGGARGSIEGQVVAGLGALQQATPIGGRLYRSQVVEVAMLPPGVLDAQVGLPDVALEPTEALTLEPALSWRDAP